MAGTYPQTAPTRGTYQWLQLRVGTYLRKELGDPSLETNADASTWDPYQVGMVDEFIQSGLFQFYYPPLVPGQKIPYEWSFLKPEATIATANADFDYDLPSDFGGIAEDFVFTSGDGKKKPKRVSAEEIMALRGNGSETGTPEYVAVRPKSSDGSAAQGFEVIVYPTPTEVETLRYRYVVEPPALTTANEYPLGTLAHAETIAASCLAAAETYWRGVMGPMRQYFLERLRASVMLDMRGNIISSGDVRDMWELSEAGMTMAA